MVQRNVFSVSSIAKVLRAGDSARFKIDLFKDKHTIVSIAANAAVTGDANIAHFFRTTIKGKDCVSYSDYTTNLILRTVSRYLAQRFRITLPNRDRIIKGVIEALMDTTPMYIVRRDVASFYESVPTTELRGRLVYDTAIPRTVRHYLNLFFEQHCSKTPNGLPRGIGLSAVLVELAMEQFDKQVRAIPGVYRYFRYADDILIFAFKDSQNVTAQVDKLLPPGMVFNKDKSGTTNLVNGDKKNVKTVHFEYLGYKFEAPDLIGGKEPRTIKVGISDKKIKRLKSRIILSLRDHRKKPDGSLLCDRIRFISGNYRVHRRGISSIGETPYVWSGIYYNYRQCGVYEKGQYTEVAPTELKILDGFFHSLIKSSGSEFSAHLNSTLTPKQRAQLSKISFYKGFSTRIAARIAYSRLTSIKMVWRNG